MIDKDVYKFCWIVDFPMFERDEETGDVIFSHNPFSMPQGGMDSLLNKDPLEVLAYQYDVVCNGVELSSGAIRNHSLEIMLKAFDIAGYAPEVVFDRFPALSGAFKYGAPPHGGLAYGLDRWVSLFAGLDSIRDCIAFPKNNSGRDVMLDAPAALDQKQLDELQLALDLKEE
jgi:aspartyl-tRNA synthetase